MDQLTYIYTLLIYMYGRVWTGACCREANNILCQLHNIRPFVLRKLKQAPPTYCAVMCSPLVSVHESLMIVV